MISTYKGSKVALAACICRMPSKYVEPGFVRKYRQLTNKNELSSAKLTIADGLAYLKTPGHFLPSIEERNKVVKDSKSESKSSLKTVSDQDQLDLLLSSEGLPTMQEENEDVSSPAGSSKSSDALEDPGTQSLQGSNLQWLLVRYKDCPEIWTFPYTHRRNKDTALSTLMRLCQSQLGMNPHFPSFAPVAHRAIPEIANSQSPPTKLFYYRGTIVPRNFSDNIQIPSDSDILDTKWVTRSDIVDSVTKASWLAVRDALPLD